MRRTLDLTVLPGLGGRLWQVNLRLSDRFLFQNFDFAGPPVDLSRLEDLPTRSPPFGFPALGAAKRSWIAPGQQNGAPALPSHRAGFRRICSGVPIVGNDRDGSEVVPKRTCRQAHHRNDVTGEWTLPHREIGNAEQQRRMTGNMVGDDAENRPAQLVDPAAPHPMAPPSVRRMSGSLRRTPGPAQSVCRCAGLREFKIGPAHTPPAETLIRCDDAYSLVALRKNATLPHRKTRFSAHVLPFEVFKLGRTTTYCEARMAFARPATLGSGGCPSPSTPNGFPSCQAIFLQTNRKKSLSQCMS